MPCNCNARDLFDAAERGCAKCCKGFVDQAGTTMDGIYLGERMCKDRTALMVAAYTRKTECVRILAEKEAGMRDADGMTALMYAAWKGYLDCVQILAPLEKGIKDANGRTAK